MDEDIVSVAGRPAIELTEKHWKVIEKACWHGRTGEQIAKLLGISYDTLVRRLEEHYCVNFAEFRDQKKEAKILTLLETQWNAALQGNATMLVWLGKQEGQTDQIQHQGGVKFELSYNPDKLDTDAE